MTQREKILCRILSSHLWGKRLSEGLSLPHDAFVQLVELARKQTVLGVMGQSLMDQHVGLERVDAAQLFLMVGDIGEHNKAVTAALCELCRLLHGAEVPFVIVKGQTIGLRYPHPESRTAGDVDFYVSAEHFDKAKTLIEQVWRVEMKEEEGGQHYTFTKDDVLFEMHFNLLVFWDQGIQRYWERLLSKAKPELLKMRGVNVPTLPPTLNVLYTFMHLYHHLIELGVGLRQFCDVGILLHSCRGAIDPALLREWLVAMDFHHAFQAVEWVLVHEMGLPAEDCALPIDETDGRSADDILDIVFTGGNFGKYSLENGLRSGMRYYFETGWKKLGRYRRLYSLSPRETRATLFKEMPMKVWQAVTGKI